MSSRSNPDMSTTDEWAILLEQMVSEEDGLHALEELEKDLPTLDKLLDSISATFPELDESLGNGNANDSSMRDLSEQIQQQDATQTHMLPQSPAVVQADAHSALHLNVTNEDVAEWMEKEVEERWELEQEYVVAMIPYLFGEQFLYENNDGNPALAKSVLRAFRKRTETTIVWVRSERCWRKRQGHDPSGRRQVD